MKCRFCLLPSCIKKGRQRNGIQKYHCKCCGKYQQDYYSKWSWIISDAEVKMLVKESSGIRSMVRVLGISANTVMKRILLIAERLKPRLIRTNAVYEMDEMKLFVGHSKNEAWVMYAIDRYTRETIAIKVGRRTKLNLGFVIHKMIRARAREIRTDLLPLYR